MDSKHKIAVAIPCYRVKAHILKIIDGIGQEVWRIYVIDDCCPDESGAFVSNHCKDPRVVVLRNKKNMGVGGAVMAGYSKAIEDGATVIVKIDGDGQMDPRLLSYFTEPILTGRADYTKGNRFYDLSKINRMPPIRLFGNSILSFLSKFSTGYWRIFDPTNGYTAISSKVAMHLPLEKISSRYFFETDLLFRLNTFQAVVMDIPMDAFYSDEESHLKISSIFGEFLYKHVRNYIKRIFYNYFLRDFNIASIELLLGFALIVFGGSYGGYYWYTSAAVGITTPAGTVMLAALPLFVGFQLLLAFLNFDIAAEPKNVLHTMLPSLDKDRIPPTKRDY